MASLAVHRENFLHYSVTWSVSRTPPESPGERELLKNSNHDHSGMEGMVTLFCGHRLQGGRSPFPRWPQHGFPSQMLFLLHGHDLEWAS